MSEFMHRVLASPYLWPAAFGIVSALVTFAGPAIVGRFPKLAPVLALLRRIGLDASTPRTGRDAYQLYAAAKAHTSATGSTLPAFDDLPAKERAAWEASVTALRTLAPASSPPSAPKDPDSTGNGAAGPLVGLALLCIVASTQTGCAGAQEQLRGGLEAARDVVAVAEPCMAAEHDRELMSCNGDATCESTVRAHWAPIADALDAFHAAWCTLAPDSEGC